MQRYMRAWIGVAYPLDAVLDRVAVLGMLAQDPLAALVVGKRRERSGIDSDAAWRRKGRPHAAPDARRDRRHGVKLGTQERHTGIGKADRGEVIELMAVELPDRVCCAGTVKRRERFEAEVPRGVRPRLVVEYRAR